MRSVQQRILFSHNTCDTDITYRQSTRHTSAKSRSDGRPKTMQIILLALHIYIAIIVAIKRKVLCIALALVDFESWQL